MATPTNDAMFVSLKVQYPTLSTLGDLMYAFALDNGYNFRDSLGYEFYAATGATLGQLVAIWLIRIGMTQILLFLILRRKMEQICY
jgi:hypothetical protein